MHPYKIAMLAERHVRLFRNGRNQAVRIPREFEFEAEEIIIRREDGRLILEPLSRPGQPIGPNDLLIAAHALALECTLVTANVCEFTRVAGLAVVNWL